MNYWMLTKPRTVFLLTLTGLCGALIGFGISGKTIDWLVIILVTASIVLGSAGANSITCYIDRDIDAIMDRTKRRPLPSGKINPPINALKFGIVLSLLALAISAMINILYFTLMIIGLLDNIIIYSRWLKRKNPINIIAGSFSGGAPAMGGYVAATYENLLIGVLLAAIVVLWIPMHIWSLALRYKEDYEKAGVPMLPVVVEEKVAMRCIASTSIMMVIFSILLPFYAPFGLFYIVTALVMGLLVLSLNTLLVIKPSKRMSWIVFKFSSPYLAILFISAVIDLYLAI